MPIERFEFLKQLTAERVMLSALQQDGQLYLLTDASDVGLGCVLMQEQPQGIERLEFASRKLTETEHRNGILENEKPSQSNGPVRDFRNT